MLPTPKDQLGRGLDDLRISVIDRCNFRCSFCMPADRQYEFLPRSELLSFEEITRVSQIFVRVGVRKLRLTGGEPLLRSQLDSLIAMLAAIPGVEDLALTTNGALLGQCAERLAAAGLGRVTVSLESLHDETFSRLNGVGYPVARVLEGIEAAKAAGLCPIKINTVVMRGVNDHEIGDLARYFKARGHVVRFIEYMDVGTLNGWRIDEVLSAREIISRLNEELPVERVPAERDSDTATRYRYLDDGLEVGVIASITEPFCGACTRARISSDGKLFLCLFGSAALDLRALLRSGASDDEIEGAIRASWSQRADRYSEERRDRMQAGLFSPEPKVEMFRIGG